MASQASQKSSQSQTVKKAQALSKELDRLIAQYGPTFPGLAAVLNGSRKLLYAPAPSRGLPGRPSKGKIKF